MMGSSCPLGWTIRTQDSLYVSHGHRQLYNITHCQSPRQFCSAAALLTLVDDKASSNLQDIHLKISKPFVKPIISGEIIEFCDPK